MMKTNLHLSRYWICQLIGWSTAALYWAVTAFLSGNFRFDVGVVQFITDVLFYISLTHLYRNFALSRGWGELWLTPMVKRLVPAVFIMGLLYMVVTIIKIYLIRAFFNIGLSIPLLDFARQHWLEIFIAGIRLMSIWLLAYHLYHYAQREINLVRENGKLELNIKQSQLDKLSAQLNPHFLFNSLNTIKALVGRDPDLARRGIDLLGELLRNGLYHDNMLMVTLKEELDLVNDYIELEQLRMEERLKFKTVTDQQLMSVPVPKMCLQTLVENAVKHGISTLIKGGEICIEMKAKDGQLNLLVKNTGKLGDVLNPNGIGLHNLHKRIELAYAGKANFNIYQREENIVIAELNLPFK